MKCNGCGSSLTLIQYQARSADEAHSSSYRCPLCPLDVTKFSNPIPVPHLYLKKSKRETRKTPTIDSSHSRDSRLLCVASKKTSIIDGYQLSEARCRNCLDSTSTLFKCYSSGPWEGLAVCQRDKKNIGLNAFLLSVSILPVVIEEGKEYIDFEYTQIDGYIVVLQDGKVQLMHDVGLGSESIVLDHLSIAYTMGFSPRNLSSYVSSVLLGALSNMNARAYDAASGEDHKDKFSTKPDGERMWLVRAGSTWLYCKRLGFEIRSWEIDNTLQYMSTSPICPVIDIEFMLTLSPILIDVLLTSDAKVCPYDRDLDWIRDEMSSLYKEFNYLSVVQTRDFFDTYEDAYQYSKTVRYPTDGIIAVSPRGTDMKKLKPIKSIELKLEENGTLVTKDNKALFVLEGQSSYSPGDILEIRFSISDGHFNIRETFHRPDKISANDSSAIQAVISSCNDHDSDSVVRTMMWRWSNKLRFYMYERANSMDDSKNIILDIGSGSGQSTDAFDRVPGCSFILVEPNKDSCTALARKLRVSDIYDNPRSITAAIPQLKRGTRKYHILNCKLGDILSDKSVVSGIKNIIRCAVSCFSAHYIMQDIDELTSLDIPLIGCYYSYDGLQVGESIINTSGIHMTKVSDERATVKWGKDKLYDEPITASEDEPLSVTVLDALDIVSLDSGSQNQIVERACSSVKILISK